MVIGSKQPDNFPQSFEQIALNLIHKLVNITASAFYLLNADMRRRGVAVYNTEEEVVEEYHEYFREIDPLNPDKFQETNEQIVCIDEEISFEKLQKTRFYRQFMRPNNFRYTVDMFLRREGEIVAVISMLRDDSMSAFSEGELELLRSLQPFMEYTLNSVYLPKRTAERTSLQKKYKLTPRELDVVELIIAGSSNKGISNELNLSLSTVKTHLLHIFQKIDVVSRADLLSRIISDLTAKDI